jgi:transposase
MGIAATEIIEENERLKGEVKVLSLRVKSLEKELYGRRADKRPMEDAAQTRLEGIEESSAWEAEKIEATRPAARKERKGKKKGPKPLNPDLPRVTESVPDPDLKDLICPVTGQMMKRAFTEKIEVLARKPPEYYVREIIRTVFASPTGDAVSYSPWPVDVLPKSRIDVSLIASIVSGRFADHQPYHRQSQQLSRYGVDLAPNTQGRIRQKGFTNRSLAVGWAVMAHNLWLISRLLAQQDRQAQAA